MNKYLVIDAMMSGTGIRDQYESGSIEPETLGISDRLNERLRDWVRRYTNEHFDGYSNKDLLERLDREGIEISKEVRNELPGTKVTYLSDAFMSRHDI